MPLGLPAPPPIGGGFSGAGRGGAMPRQRPPLALEPGFRPDIPKNPIVQGAIDVASKVPPTPFNPSKIAVQGALDVGRRERQLGFVNSIPERAEVSAMSNWYKDQANMMLGGLGRGMVSSGAQMLHDSNYYNSVAQHITGSYGNDVASLNNQRFAQVDLAGRQLGSDRIYSQEQWDNLQKDIGNRRTNADQVKAMQDWLTGRNRVHTTTERDLGFDRSKADYNTSLRKLMSAATGRGAVTSKGHRLDRADALTAKTLADRGTTLGYDRSFDSLQAGERGDQLGWQAAIDALNNQYAQGLSGYNHQMRGQDISQAGLRNTAQGFDIRQNQLGLDYRHGLNQNAQSAYTNAQQIKQQQQQHAQQVMSQLASLYQSAMSGAS